MNWDWLVEPCIFCGRETAGSSEETHMVICDGCEDKVEVAALKELVEPEKGNN